MPKHDDSGALLRDLRKKGHYTIDNEFLDSGISALVKPAGIAVYNVLCRHANINTSRAFPSVPTIAAKTGLSERQIYRTLLVLQSYNVISYTPKRGRGHQNEYCLLDVSEWAKIKGDCVSGFTKGDCVSGLNSVKGDKIDTLKGDCVSPEQTKIERNNITTTNKGDDVGVVVVFPDSELLELIKKYSIVEPLVKLKKMVLEQKITDAHELEKGLLVASQKAHNKSAIISYARTLFFEGLCTESGTSGDTGRQQQQPPNRNQYADSYAQQTTDEDIADYLADLPLTEEPAEPIQPPEPTPTPEPEPKKKRFVSASERRQRKTAAALAKGIGNDIPKAHHTRKLTIQQQQALLRGE